MRLPLRALLVFAGLAAAAAAGPANVLFIMTDQHSADAMSFRMGDRYLRTPALDRLAARGTYFSRAYTPNPLCMPARNSIFTGRYPHETGITDNTKSRLDPAEFTSMGTYFQRAGYHANPQFPVGNFSPEMWQALRWSYYRLIEKVDAEIGRVLDALQAAGLEKDTLIVFTADHGECAGAHGMNQKTVLYEEAARVPLIVSAPGQAGARVADAFVNTGTDLLPTLLDYAGLPRSARLTGLSLRAPAAGQPLPAWRDQVVVQNNMTQTFAVNGNVPATEGRMLRTDRYKYTVYAHGRQRESLVDLASDPGEMTNLARDPAHRETLLALRARLLRWGVENRDPLVSEMLADDVKPREFPELKVPKNQARAEGILRQKKKS